MSPNVLVFGRRRQGSSARSTDRRPKSAKARSRGKLGTGLAASAMGIKAGAALDGKRDARRRHSGKPKRVHWTSRRAREVQQRTAGELIDGYRRGTRQNASTTSAFRHECCTRILLIFATCVISNSCAWQKQHIRQPLRD